MAEFLTLLVAKSPDASERAAQWARGELIEVDVADGAPVIDAITDVVVEGALDDREWMVKALDLARSVANGTGQVSLLVTAGALKGLGEEHIVQPLEGWAAHGVSAVGADVVLHLRPIATPEKTGITRDSLEGAAMLAEMLLTLADGDRFDRDDFEYRTSHVTAQFRALPRLKRELATANIGPRPSTSASPAPAPAAAAAAKAASAPGRGIGGGTRRTQAFALIAAAAVGWALGSIVVAAVLNAGATGFLVLLTLGAVIGLGVDGRRRAQRAHREVGRLASHVARLDAQAAKRHSDVQQRLSVISRHGTQIAEVSESVQAGLSIVESTADLLTELDSTLDARLESSVAQHALTLTEQSRRDARTLYEQIEAMIQLRDVVTVTGPTPRLRGWAASPDILKLLVDDVVMRRPTTIVECGSGASTVWLAMAVRTLGLPARVVALEHDVKFAAATRRWLEVCGVADIAEVRDAPLEPVALDEFEGSWYSQDAIVDLHDVGLLFIDGPPADTGESARYPALPLFHSRLAADAAVVLDDLIRAEERSITDRWAEAFPDLGLERVAVEKGAAVFRRRSTTDVSPDTPR